MQRLDGAILQLNPERSYAVYVEQQVGDDGEPVVRTDLTIEHVAEVRPAPRPR
jgi:hypothetical protein